jgi:uncharacterized protein DUF6069
MTSTTTPPAAQTRTASGRTLILAGAAAAVVVNAAIATAARALGASPEFQPLTPAAYIPLTIIGFLLGTAGWALIRAKTRNPARVLRIVVPVVLLLSFIPDLGLLLSGSRPGTSGGAVAALALMHLVVAAAALPALTRALPLQRR